MFTAWVLHSFISYSDFIYEITADAADKIPFKNLQNVNIYLGRPLQSRHEHRDWSSTLPSSPSTGVIK